MTKAFQNVTKLTDGKARQAQMDQKLDMVLDNIDPNGVHRG